MPVGARCWRELGAQRAQVRQLVKASPARAFCEPAVFPLHSCKVDSPTLLKQLVEYGLGVRCLQKTSSDVCVQNCKKTTFEALKRVYEERGGKFKELTINNGMVDWCISGEYSVVTLAAGSPDKFRIQVTEKVSKKTTAIPQDLVGDNPSSISSQDIKDNFNAVDAYILINDDTFRLAQLFPKTSRALKRRLSEQLGATGGVLCKEEEEEEAEPPAKRAKAPPSTKNSTLAACKKEDVPDPEGHDADATAAAAAAASAPLAEQAHEEAPGDEDDEEEEQD